MELEKLDHHKISLDHEIISAAGQYQKQLNHHGAEAVGLDALLLCFPVTTIFGFATVILSEFPRTVVSYIINDTDSILVRKSYEKDLKRGVWFPIGPTDLFIPPRFIFPKQAGMFITGKKLTGVMTGTEGNCIYSVCKLDENQKQHEFLLREKPSSQFYENIRGVYHRELESNENDIHLWWDNPSLGSNKCKEDSPNKKIKVKLEAHISHGNACTAIFRVSNQTKTRYL